MKGWSKISALSWIYRGATFRAGLHMETKFMVISSIDYFYKLVLDTFWFWIRFRSCHANSSSRSTTAVSPSISTNAVPSSRNTLTWSTSSSPPLVVWFGISVSGVASSDEEEYRLGFREMKKTPYWPTHSILQMKIVLVFLGHSLGQRTCHLHLRFH